jgi:hypothetical protein
MILRLKLEKQVHKDQYFEMITNIFHISLYNKLHLIYLLNYSSNDEEYSNTILE